MHKADVHCVWQAESILMRHFGGNAANSYRVDSDTQRLDALRELAASDGLGPRVLITDLLGLTAEDARQHRAFGYDLLVQMNESAVNVYPADLTFNGDGFLSHRITEVAGGRFYEGCDYHVVDPRVVRARPTDPWHGGTVQRVLVTFGGADPGQMTEQFVTQLPVASDITWTVVAGPAFSPDRVRHLREQADGRYTVVISPDNMTPMILDHDAVITMGGLTSYEAMCLGRPVLAVEWTYMAPYVRGLDAAGLVGTLGGIEGSANRVRGLLTDATRLRQLALAGWKTIDGHGAARVVTEIALAAQRLKRG
jgi:spore coat polysaccharide biosynthesis predicted glycosyltransferase SpsG